ncbi:hypothetical protein P618_200984 [Holospora obtusa F1]|uniref:Uncharacterized protein n=1 Tax=Holospora obtusa F1 TaxID=1399147 RepID=W6TDZ7_HOLOB|nr:hypothetical protein [Holospora obtusa]ETZ06839.1 hypothetical protein P618_200984 [Holospora obtusa F1]
MQQTLRKVTKAWVEQKGAQHEATYVHMAVDTHDILVKVMLRQVLLLIASKLAGLLKE